MEEEDSGKRKTATMLDTSSDEDDDQPKAMDLGFVTQAKSMAANPMGSGIPQPTGIPRTQALPKGKTTESDLLADLNRVDDNDNNPMISHQLPKG